MRFSLRLVPLIAVILGTASCATYCIDVTGYLDPARPSSLMPGKTVYIMSNPKADNPLLDKEIALKMANLLTQKGYRVSPSEFADFHLVFTYGTDRGSLRTESIRRPQRIRVYHPDLETWTYETVDSYEPYSVQYYTHSLHVRVIDARRFGDGVQDKVVWVADTVSEEQSSDLRDLVNYLLVATFEYFGQDTGKAVRVRLAPGDFRVQRLKRVW